MEAYLQTLSRVANKWFLNYKSNKTFLKR
jgi:hypothetical protein